MVGALITIALAVGIIGTLWLARGGLSAGYPLHAVFPWAEGLKQGQPVLLSGVNVGYVADVDFKPDGLIDVTFRINKDYRVPDNATVSVANVGFFGDKAIAIKPERPSLEYFEENDTIPNGPPSPTIEQIFGRLDTVSFRISEVTHEFEMQLVDSGGLQDLRRTMAATNDLVRQLSAVAAEQSRQLTLTQVALRRSASALDSAAIDSTVRNLAATSANMTTLTSSLNQTTTQLNGLLTRLEQGEGTAGKLLSDTLLYSDLRRLVTRVDSVTADFKKNPRRYINLEIF